MWPWEEEPYSIAHGILDDETYDWHAIVAGILRSDGSAVVVDEATLAKWRSLPYAELAFEILSLYIDDIPADDAPLRALVPQRLLLRSIWRDGIRVRWELSVPDIKHTRKYWPMLNCLASTR